MAVDIPFRRDFSFEYRRLEPVAPMIRRIIACNPSPFTFKGSGTYIIGHGYRSRLGSCEKYPVLIDLLLKNRHEIGLHGYSMSGRTRSTRTTNATGLAARSTPIASMSAAGHATGGRRASLLETLAALPARAL